MTTVCEIGPVEMRRLDSATTASASGDPALVGGALEGGDGRVVLVGDEPMPLHVAWRAALQPLLEGADRALLIHPSAWPVTRINSVRAAAADLVRRVELTSRAQVLSPDGDAVVVEIGAQAIAVIGGGGPIDVHPRSRAPGALAGSVTDAVRNRHGGRTVLVDAPKAVAGAEAVASLISTELTAARVRVRIIADTQLNSAATTLVSSRQVQADPGRVAERAGAGRRTRRTTVLAAVAVAAVTAAALVGSPADEPAPPRTLAVNSLVEGRVVMDVPVDWVVRRVTDGPGSARVQVMSPSDGDAALHLTQSRSPAVDLTATAVTLRRAVDQEATGSFVDFNPSDTRMGRPAVTYREVRPGREVLWTVLVDGDLRISIGCQHGDGRVQSIAAACDDAVRSARRAR